MTEHLIVGGLFAVYFGFLLALGLATGKMPTPIAVGTDAYRDEKRFKYWTLASLNAFGMLAGIYIFIWGYIA